MNAPGNIKAVLCVAFSCGLLHAQTPPAQLLDSPSSVPLTTTEAVQKLSSAQAAMGRPVRLRGVVTFSQSGWRLLFVQDATGGIYCETVALTTFPEVGHEVDIEGISAPGGNLPVVVVGKFRDLGPKPFPSAIPAAPVQLWKRQFDGDLVRVTGYVISATVEQLPVPYMDMRVLNGEYEMRARVVGLTNVSPKSLAGSHVEIEGVYGLKANNRRQFSDISILAARPAMLRVLTDATQLAGALPFLSFSKMQNISNSIIRTRGVVIDGGTNDFWLGDEHGGIRVINAGYDTVRRGDELELLGMIHPLGPERKLSMLRILSSKPGVIPRPVKISAADELDPKRHGQLVQTEGEFLFRISNSHGGILVLRDGEHVFEARTRYAADKETSTLRPGSRLQLTGILRKTGKDADGGMMFHIVIVEPGHIKQLAPPPWSPAKTRLVVNSLAIALGMGLLTLAVVHRRLKDSARRLKETDAELLLLNANLEQRIRSRTAELESTNRQLLKEISERKQAEAIRASLEVQLRQSQKMEAIGTLAGGIAHDFNNILAAIMGFAELAKMESACNPAILSNLDDLLTASHRAKDLVRQILAFSRREDFQRKVVPLDPIITESVRLLRAAFPATLDLRTSIIGPLPHIQADATLIQQVIMNLATNAAQAIGHRPGQVEILAREHTESPAPDVPGSGLRPGSYVMIQVRDNGSGMAPDVVERIFEPFFTTKGPGQGTGLGLAVVHGIVTAHEGVIRVESAPGQGSTFTILLPTAQDHPSPPPQAAQPLLPARGTERILLVDDEQPLLAVGEKMLRRSGYQVTACSSSEQALKTFRQSPSGFDLVITDYSMPIQSGAELAREMLQIRPDLLIIVSSGYTACMTREDALQMGFCDFLQKPVEFDLLCRAVRSALDRVSTANLQP